MDDEQFPASYCADCTRYTRHRSLYKVTKSHENSSGEKQLDSYEIVKCLGCDNLTFMFLSFDVSQIPVDGSATVLEKLYSPMASNREAMPSHAAFPEKVRMAYLNTIKSANAGALLAASAALRATVEAVCIDAGCQRRASLETRIDELVAKQLLAPKQAAFWHDIRFLGNDAAHQIYEPDAVEFDAALGILETLLTTLYILPGLSQRLQLRRLNRTSTAN